MLNKEGQPPVITVDGPSGVGKGTISVLLARALGWHFLDSGILYRAFVWLAREQQCNLNYPLEPQKIADAMHIQFVWNEETKRYKIYSDQQEVTDILRSEVVSQSASQIAAMPEVRKVLIESQRAFQKAPGLVADGRDMGTVIFPDAKLKFFLTATVEERAERRYKQLKEMGLYVNLTQLQKSMEERDSRDTERSTAPLKAASDAINVDTTHHSAQEVYDILMHHIKRHEMLRNNEL